MGRFFVVLASWGTPPVPEPVEGHTGNLTDPAPVPPVPEPVEGPTSHLTNPAPILPVPEPVEGHTRRRPQLH